MFSLCAISSIAHSKAHIPGDSPGARMKIGGAMLLLAVVFAIS